MIFKRFTLSLSLRLMLLIISAAVAVFTGMKGHPLLMALLFCLTAGIMINTIYFINSIPRKLSYFFDAVRNEDSSLHYPENVRDKNIAGLHGSLNRLNELISEIKVRNERNEKFFRELLKSSSTGILAVDEKGFIELVNDQALQLTGLKALSHLDRLRQQNSELAENLENLKPGLSSTLKILVGNELRQLSAKVAYLHFGERRYRIFSLNDIRPEMEEIELESWQKLIRVLTHEIMNSIAPITSLSNTIRRFFKADAGIENSTGIPPEYIAQTVEGLSVIEETGKGLMHFVDNYRKLAKVPKPKFKTIDIDDWMSRIDLLERSKMEDEHIQLIMEKRTGKKEFFADENLLNQVVINIMNNAADALKKSGKKEIRMTVDEIRDYNLLIIITDTGEGISADDLEKIFIPFFTTKENGSGIGLSLARQIMRLHKGSINVHSLPGKGTSFFLKI